MTPTLRQRALRAFARYASGLATRAMKISGVPIQSEGAAALFGYAPTAAGMNVTEWTALNYSAVWAARGAISDNVSSLPFPTYERGEKDSKPTKTLLPDYPTADLLQVAPNDEVGAMSFRGSLTDHAMMWGNGYAEIERDYSGDTRKLHGITPDRVRPDRLRGTGELYYIIHNADGSEDTLGRDDMLHLTGPGFDGVMGYSVVTLARETIGLGLATEKHGATYFGNGTVPSGTLNTDVPINNPETIKNLRESWNLMHQGVDRAHRTAILTHGLKYTPLTESLENAQFLSTREFNVLEIARWFNVPPHMIRDLSRATHSNIEQQSLEFVIYSLRPWLVRWEQEVKRKLIRKQDRSVFCEHAVDALLRGDIAARYQAYATGRQWGWLSVNDVLECENRNPVDGGGVYLQPVNMVDATKADKILEKPAPSSQGGMGGKPQ